MMIQDTHFQKMTPAVGKGMPFRIHVHFRLRKLFLRGFVDGLHARSSNPPAALRLQQFIRRQSCEGSLVYSRLHPLFKQNDHRHICAIWNKRFIMWYLNIPRLAIPAQQFAEYYDSHLVFKFQ